MKKIIAKKVKKDTQKLAYIKIQKRRNTNKIILSIKTNKVIENLMARFAADRTSNYNYSTQKYYESFRSPEFMSFMETRNLTYKPGHNFKVDDLFNIAPLGRHGISDKIKETTVDKLISEDALKEYAVVLSSTIRELYKVYITPITIESTLTTTEVF